MNSLGNEVDHTRTPVGLLDINNLESHVPLGELLGGQAMSRPLKEAHNMGVSTWEDCPRTEISAVIGQLLHGVKDRHAYYKGSSRALLQRSDVDHLFVNAVSEVKDFMSSNDLEEIVQEPAKLTCFLVPSPWTEAGVEALRMYPRIALCFGGDTEGSSFELLDMFAIYDEFRADVMLPKSGFDVRFLRRRIMKNSKHGLTDSQVDSYTTFIKSLALSGAQIQAPLQVDLRVPDWPRSQGVLGALHEPTGDKKIPYRLSTIEHRQRTSALTGRLKLNYTAIEAGRIQGSYGEFILEPSDTEDISATKFIDESLEVIRAIQGAARNIRRKN